MWEKDGNMDGSDKAVDMERINKLTRDKEGWAAMLDDLDSQYVNYHISQKCTWVPDTSKVTDIKKGTYTDWK